MATGRKRDDPENGSITPIRNRPQGPKGDPGPASAPGWYSDTQPPIAIGDPHRSDDVTVNTIDVPAGTYGVQAVSSLFEYDADEQSIACRLDGSTATSSGGRGVTGFNDSFANNFEQTKTLAARVTLGSGSSPP